MSEQAKKPDSDLIARLSFVFSEGVKLLTNVMWKGLTRENTWTKSTVKFWLLYLVILALFVYAPSWDIPRIAEQLPWIPSSFGAWIYLHFARWGQLLVLFVVPFVFWFAFLGSWSSLKLRRYQIALDHLGLKTSTGLTPQAVNIIQTSQDQKKVLVKIVGLDPADFKSQKAVLESGLNEFVQDIRLAENNRQILEIRISKKELPTLIPYDEVSHHLVEPFSFMIGEGMNGFLIASLLKIYHLLVAGSSGGGKSFFVKQLLVGLLQSSKHIQLYLLDLKSGIEVKVFEKLENVLIAKNAVSAIQTLDAVVREMDRRFEYLEKHGHTEIDCERDRLDRIVVLVDEASELFTLVRSSKALRASAESARDLADRIAKLGRVAGIHLILATQKVVKETIDTRVQLNINARMIFRVNTTAGSMTVLGNKLANELPEIGGRGIWSVGSRDLFVQTPKLDNAEVGVKVALLTEKFNGNRSPLFQKMLSIKQQKANSDAKSSQADIADGVNAAKGAF